MYEHITPETIKTDILGDIDLWDTQVGSFAYTLIAPVGYELWKYYMQLEAMVSMVFPDETSGLWIDKHAEQYGMERKPGEKAACEITFTGTDGTVIPAGKVFLTEDGLRFTLDSAVTITGGTGTGVLSAEEAGAAYNTAENGIIRQQSPLSGLTSWTNTAATGGVDEETDESLLERYYDRLRKPATSGNVYHYEQWAREVPGVGAVRVIPLWDGPGTVKVVIAGDGDTVPDGEVVAAAQSYIETVAPIGADVTVEAASAENITIVCTVQVLTGADSESIIESCKTAIRNYLASLREQWTSGEVTVRYNEIIETLMGVEGVIDLTGLTLNGGTANIDTSGMPVESAFELTAQEVSG